MALAPIRLGSAALTTLIFETGSQITTSTSGIQACSVKALYPDGQNVFNAVPVAGSTFNSVFGNSYLPSSFVVDYTDSGPQIEYLEGNVARITITFKRQDPAALNQRKIFVDSVINYDSELTKQHLMFVGYSGGIFGGDAGASSFSPIGFPEPVVTVKYNSNTRPSIGGGTLTSLYALPGSSNASGFPSAPAIVIPLSLPMGIGATVVYFNGTAYVSVGPLTHPVVFNFSIEYRPNILGWQLQRIKSDPVAAATFYDVEEEWRTFYFFYAVTSATIVPPP